MKVIVSMNYIYFYYNNEYDKIATVNERQEEL